MVEQDNYKLNDFVSNVALGSLTVDDFINIRSIDSAKLKTFRQETLQELSDDALVTFASNLLSGYMKHANGVIEDVIDNTIVEASVLFREQGADKLLCNFCLKEIGRRKLTFPGSPEELSSTKLDPAILACYAPYTEKMMDAIPKMSDDKIRNMLSKNITDAFKGNANNLEGRNLEGWIQVNFARLVQDDKKFASDLKSVLGKSLDDKEVELEQALGDLLQKYDVRANVDAVAKTLVNKNIAWSVMFIMYKNIIPMPSSMESEGAVNALKLQHEVAKPDNLYISNLATQDLVGQIKEKSIQIKPVALGSDIHSELLAAADKHIQPPSHSVDDHAKVEGVHKKVNAFLHDITSKAGNKIVNEIKHIKNAIGNIFGKISRHRSGEYNMRETADEHSQGQGVKANYEQVVSDIDKELSKAVKFLPPDYKPEFISRQSDIMKELKGVLKQREKGNEAGKENKHWQQSVLSSHSGSKSHER